MKTFSTLTLAIALLCAGSALAAGAKKAPPDVQSAFEAFIAKFRAALAHNDAAAVAGMAQLPFQGDPAVATAAQFQAKIYKANFTAKNRACLQNAAPAYDRDPDNNDSFFFTCGDASFVFTKTAAGFLLADIGAND